MPFIEQRHELGAFFEPVPIQISDLALGQIVVAVPTPNREGELLVVADRACGRDGLGGTEITRYSPLTSTKSNSGTGAQRSVRLCRMANSSLSRVQARNR